MRRILAVSIATFVTLAATAERASADITGFVGITLTPQNHALRGFAIGAGLVVIGFEFEYSDVVENTPEGLPSLRTGSGNLLIQTPVEIHSMQFYGTTGGGLYRERLATIQETHFETNVGGGVKIRLAGPLRVRLDYRVFRLQGSPIQSTYQRFYVGANLSF